VLRPVRQRRGALRTPTKPLRDDGRTC
jgi:hypothetical protein